MHARSYDIGSPSTLETLDMKKPSEQRMRKPHEDPAREERIAMEIVVDCYDESERAMGWYYYLQDTLQFPFTVQCVAERAVSALRVNDEVEAISMAPVVECEHEMFGRIQWEREGLAVPPSQCKPVAADEQTVQTVEDLHYWVKEGYEF
jgi:hypothetical protein